MRDNPHSLQELNCGIWWEIVDTSRHELCHLVRNVSNICEAHLGAGVEHFETHQWNTVSWTAGHYELLAKAAFICSRAVRQLPCWGQRLNVHSVSVEALVLWGGVSYFDGCKPSLMETELVKEFLRGLQLCQCGLPLWSDKCGCRCANLIWIRTFFYWALFLDP